MCFAHGLNSVTSLVFHVLKASRRVQDYWGGNGKQGYLVWASIGKVLSLEPQPWLLGS